MRRSRYIKYENTTLSLNEWADKLGISANTLRRRLRNGWSMHECMTGCKRHKLDRIEFAGEVHALAEWAKLLGLSYHTLLTRYRKGWKSFDLFFGARR